MRNLLIYISLLVISLSCIKEPEQPVSAGQYENGLIILCEGLFNANNSSLAYYDLETGEVYNNVFLAENARGLGDTANDMVLYEKNGVSYLIICVDVSSQVEILNASTLKSVAQIPMFDGTNARSPRRVVVNDEASKAYITNFDGTVAVIDLNTYEISNLIEVGENPDGIAYFNDRVYVPNSGGLNFPLYDSTISVIDALSENVINEYACPINSASIVVNSAEYIYLRSNGNYSDIPPSFLKINALTGEEVFKWDANCSGFQIEGEELYFYNADSDEVRKLNMITDVIDPTFSISIDGIETFGGFYFDSETENTYLIDLNGYTSVSEIFIIDNSGAQVGWFEVGLNANTIIKL